MNRRAQENLVAVIMLFVFIGVFALSLGYGPRARMVPLPVAVFGMVLTVIQLVWQNLRSTDELQVDLLEVLTNRSEKESVPDTFDGAPGAKGRADPRSRFRREIIAYGMVGFFVGLIFLLGPIPAIFIFTLGYFLLSRQYPRLQAVVYTVLFTGAIYLLFVVALDIQLYHGVLEPLIHR